ncbi:MAG: DEAD/DEAH box helicase [Deltaproteobacteria bacterium]|nr:DEAD/DEAH box helicase [Deltaproteobacteria bacterium]
MIERFYEFGLSDEVLQSLSDMGFEEPTQIQKISIPDTLKGRDIIGVAQTGTGKTASFGIPIIEKAIRGKSKKPAAIVLSPTRELAVQVAEELNRIGKTSGFISVPIYGGQSIERQIRGLTKGADIVVGTPGRVIDHIKRRTLNLSEVATVVLDEADEMLNMGFLEDMQTILSEVPTERQTLLFSATMPEQIIRISKKYMINPKKVKVDTKDLVASAIDQIFYEVRHGDKQKALTRILDVHDPGRTIVFCHTKREVDELSGKLQQKGYDTGAIHGDFTQSFREEMIAKFKKGSIDILVATDVAARGLDIKNVTHVINYSIPQNPDAYVHRIGRTGRAGKEGIAITFVTPREYSQLRLIERVAKTKIQKGKLPSTKEVKEAKEKVLGEAIEKIIGEAKHEEFYNLVDDLCAVFNPAEVAAAALSLYSGGLMVDDIAESRGGGQQAKAGMTRLFLTIGRDDKVKVGDMVRQISESSNIPGRSIGNIALFDKFSFVEVPTDEAENVIAAINKMKVGGRKVRAQTAKDNKGGGGKARGGGAKGGRKSSGGKGGGKGGFKKRR